ncbi:MAG: formyltetrahydrofolate deformylase [Bacteroidales bacterium]|nr:formyltetrahydrofolate deformylase [Bacteroidales bacterium]MBN2821012.1 formyltetrahydrofolate deformylase [Bacteroidales bacterium]
MATIETKPTAIILMNCDDNTGIIQNVTEFIDNNRGNIIDLEEHVDREEKQFFMRIEWEIENFLIPRDKIGEFFATQIAAKYGMTWNLYFSDEKPRMAIFVSKMSHCLFDLLSRVQSGEWDIAVPVIISNHNECEPIAKGFGIPYHVFPITKENKAEQEAKEIEVLKKFKVSFIVLARYMQVISDDFIQQFPNKIINIHHSFLPAFPGAKPYHSAYKRGVKIIGATSHYVTADLDEGPIITQNVAHITHKDSVEDLIRKGGDLEKIVLSKGVYKHIQRRTLVYNNRTIVFG